MDAHQHRVGTELGMAGDERFALALMHNLVSAVLGLNFQVRAGRQGLEKNAPFHFGAANRIVHFVGQIGMRPKKLRVRRLDPAIHSCA